MFEIFIAVISILFWIFVFLKGYSDFLKSEEKTKMQGKMMLDFIKLIIEDETFSNHYIPSLFSYYSKINKKIDNADKLTFLEKKKIRTDFKKIRLEYDTLRDFVYSKIELLGQNSDIFKYKLIKNDFNNIDTFRNLLEFDDILNAILICHEDEYISKIAESYFILPEKIEKEYALCLVIYRLIFKRPETFSKLLDYSNFENEELLKKYLYQKFDNLFEKIEKSKNGLIDIKKRYEFSFK